MTKGALQRIAPQRSISSHFTPLRQENSLRKSRKVVHLLTIQPASPESCAIDWSVTKRKKPQPARTTEVIRRRHFPPPPFSPQIEVNPGTSTATVNRRTFPKVIVRTTVAANSSIAPFSV